MNKYVLFDKALNEAIDILSTKQLENIFYGITHNRYFLTENSINRFLHQIGILGNNKKYIPWLLITSSRDCTCDYTSNNECLCKPISKSRNKEILQKFKKHVKDIGYSFTEVMGGYVYRPGNPPSFEPSLFITNISLVDAARLAEWLCNPNNSDMDNGTFCQDSFIYSEKPHEIYLYQRQSTDGKPFTKEFLNTVDYSYLVTEAIPFQIDYEKGKDISKGLSDKEKENMNDIIVDPQKKITKDTKVIKKGKDKPENVEDYGFTKEKKHAVTFGNFEKPANKNKLKKAKINSLVTALNNLIFDKNV